MITSLRSFVIVAITIATTTVVVAAGSTAAGAQAAPSGIPALAREFVFTTLTFSPAGATQYGLHRYTDPRTGHVLLLDQMLEDFSPAELARQRAFYEGFRQKLQRLPVARLDPQTQADYELLQNAVGFAFYSLDQEQFYRWKPQLYSENLGSALFSNISLAYAPKNIRDQPFKGSMAESAKFLARLRSARNSRNNSGR